MSKPKVTGKRVASHAPRTLSSDKTGSKSKTAAGSASSQTKTPKKTTSKEAASAASKVLRDKRTGSALSQAVRTVKSPVKPGSVKKSLVTKAIKSLSSNRSKTR